MGVIKKRARELRKHQTPAEKTLWKYVRAKKLNGYKFRRQHPVYHTRNAGVGTFTYFILDFYCHSLKLAIELDGSIHDNMEYFDNEKDEMLKELGIKVIRFKNEELNDIEGVLGRLYATIETREQDIQEEDFDS